MSKNGKNRFKRQYKPIVFASKYEVVVVPFTESPDKQKPRPVAVLSNQAYSEETGNFLGVMISSSGTHTAFAEEIRDLEAIGLVFESWFKPKIATLPINFIKKSLGTLSKRDRKSMDKLIMAIM